jgi:hypothetical protein
MSSFNLESGFTNCRFNIPGMMRFPKYMIGSTALVLFALMALFVFTNDYYGMKCNFGTIVNFFPTNEIGLIAFISIELMVLIAFWISHQTKCRTINIVVQTNGFQVNVSALMDVEGNNGLAIKIIVETLVLTRNITESSLADFYENFRD